MNDHGNETTKMDERPITEIRPEFAEILEGCADRHPVWLSRLETEEYYPIAHIPISELREGDIIDVREFKIEVRSSHAFMTIDTKTDDRIMVKTTDGNLCQIDREDVPFTRRKVVRYGRRMPI